MIATEAYYHRNCVRKLYNRYREHNAKKVRSKLDMIREMVFSEVVNFVEDIISMAEGNSCVSIYLL